MARIRSVHPDICESETMTRISASAERTFVRLWTACDDHGRSKADPRLLKARLYPLHDKITAREVGNDLAELEREQLIVLYSVDGDAYLCVHSWDEFQHPNKPAASKIPAPPDVISEVPENPPESPREPKNPAVGVEWSGEGEGRDSAGVPREPKASPKAPLPPEAEGILRDWYEHTEPRPVVAHWPEAVRTVAKFLKAGHPPRAVREALDDVPGTVSAGTLSIALDKLKKREPLTTINGRAPRLPGTATLTQPPVRFAP